MERFCIPADFLGFDDAKLKKVSLFASEQFFSDVYGLEPGQEQAAHRHAGSDKVYFVLSGTGEFAVDDEVRSMQAGAAIWCPAGSSHSVRNPGPERLALLVFMAPPPPPK